MTTTKKLQSVVLEFDLYELPTAQHKAGLAGLLLQIEDMQRRDMKPELTPTIIEQSETSATIEFTESSVQALLNEVYSARIAEAASASKWPGKVQPKRIDEVEQIDKQTKKPKKVKRFIYDIVQPDSPLLCRLFADPDNKGPWLKLWRDMLWNVPRGKPATRRPFNQRSEDEPTAEGPKAWKELLRYDKDRSKGIARTCSVSGTQLLGAQDVNAESVDFMDRSDHAFLLHFWMLTLRIFVPAIIENDGKSDFVGYSLAIPEISNLNEFCEQYPQMLAELKTDLRGYRPSQAIIDIPAEAALQFMLHLSRVAAAKGTSNAHLEDCISSIEYLHLVKLGNNIKLMASGRVSPDPDLLRKYSAIVGGEYRNPLFRSGCLTALLNGDPWFAGFDTMLVQRPWPMFVRSEKSPRMASFGVDVRKRIQSIYTKFYDDLKDLPMNDQNAATPTQPLELLIHRLVGTYVHRKTEAKTNMKWEEIKKKKKTDEKGNERIDVPKAYSEARAKVASDAYLALRSRRAQDFADYFTASICSVAQFLKRDEYQVVANALLDDPNTVKTLSLLALSANS